MKDLMRASMGILNKGEGETTYRIKKLRKLNNELK